MNEDIQLILETAKESMEGAIAHLMKELQKVRAGKANPVMLQGVMVEYYGAMTPINQVASVTAPEPRMLVVQPFEKSMLGTVERAIIEANLGLNPQNDGSIIRCPIPVLSEERRIQLVRQAKDEGENAKISVRNTRRDSNNEIKKLKDSGLPEDMLKIGEEEVQKLTNAFTTKVDEILSKKEDEIMTV